MDQLRIGLVALNLVIFAVLLTLALRNMRRSESPQVRQLWLVMILVVVGLLMGAGQRLVIQAGIIGWLPVTAVDSLLTEVQILQSLAVLVISGTALYVVRQLSGWMDAAGSVAGSILDRVSHVDLRTLDLSKREAEVLEMVGSGVLTDAELAARLHIAPSTVQSHIKSLLRKTTLRKRQDLIGVAYLVRTDRTL